MGRETLPAVLSLAAPPQYLAVMTSESAIPQYLAVMTPLATPPQYLAVVTSLVLPVQYLTVMPTTVMRRLYACCKTSMAGPTQTQASTQRLVMSQTAESLIMVHLPVSSPAQQVTTMAGMRAGIVIVPIVTIVGIVICVRIPRIIIYYLIPLVLVVLILLHVIGRVAVIDGWVPVALLGAISGPTVW